MPHWRWIVRQLLRRMWVRAALFSGFAIALALAGAFVGEFVSYDFATKVGAKSVNGILDTLASSMLAVTTFSLTAMVQAYSGATSTITPRAVQLLIDDKTAQTALSTFLGSFIFAVVGIIALSTGLYGDTGRVILYTGTIIVVAVIVVTLIRWIEHIARFGRVSDTIHRVERAATQAMDEMPDRITLEAVAPDRPEPPEHAARIIGNRTGRLVHVDYQALAEVARDAGASLHVEVLPGAFVGPARPLAWVDAILHPRQRRKAYNAFTIAADRTFDQDPRFGLVVLAETASRALSPAVNDQGTAIAVLEAGARVLSIALRHEPVAAHRRPTEVMTPAVLLGDMLVDLYRPIARDGAGVIEVQIRLQKSLGELAAIAPDAAATVRPVAQDALARARRALPEEDRPVLEKVAGAIWDPAFVG